MPFELMVGLNKPCPVAEEKVLAHFKDISQWKPILDTIMTNAYMLTSGRSRRIKVVDVKVSIIKSAEGDGYYDGVLTWSAVGGASVANVDTFVEALLGDQLRSHINLHTPTVITYVAPKNVGVSWA
jgi:hypothetical protein